MLGGRRGRSLVRHPANGPVSFLEVPRGGRMGRWGGGGRPAVLFHQINPPGVAVRCDCAASGGTPFRATPRSGQIERTQGFGMCMAQLRAMLGTISLPMRISPWIGRNTGIVHLCDVDCLRSGRSTVVVVLKRGRKQLLWARSDPAILLPSSFPHRKQE